MYITADGLARLAPRMTHTLAQTLASEMNISLPLYGANGFLSRAHFIAQACHETAGFTTFEERLHYTNATRIVAVWPRLAGRAADLVAKPESLANAAYGGRLGNRDEASGDGWKYRGRGVFQLTGRSNYQAAARDLRVDLVNQPELLLQPRFAVQSAVWFWRQHGCIEAATRDDVEAVTRAINGSRMEGLSQRRLLTEQAKRIFV